MKLTQIKANINSVVDKKHRGLMKKYKATNDEMFAAYVQMAKDYPTTIEKYL